MSLTAIAGGKENLLFRGNASKTDAGGEEANISGFIFSRLIPARDEFPDEV
jgi:hypothetical protein